MTKTRTAAGTMAKQAGFESVKPTPRALIVFVVGAVLIYFVIRQATSSPFGSPDVAMLGQLAANFGAFAVGFLIALTPLLFFSGIRDLVIAGVALVILALVLLPGVGAGLSFVSAVFGLTLGGLVLGLLLYRPIKLPKPTTFGSAEWASPEDVVAAKLTGQDGFLLGDFTMASDGPTPLRYAGDRHLLTVAPTRAGKGVSAIIPNLLTYKGSTLVIDPKGENALITAAHRYKMGQRVLLVDPWDLAASRMGTEPARFNPIDWLHPEDIDIGENAMLLADALVVSEGGKEKFWDEEAKALIVGLILYVATDAEEEGHRNLGRVRDLLMLNKDGMTELFGHMALSDQPIVASTGARSLLKKEELLSNVLATAQSHTHFLDSPRIRESLSASDFRFEDLKEDQVTIYLILPADRLNAFGRWLRLLIQQAITVNARNIGHKPRHPVLFMLDEMPALGHLAMVEQAYGLMAGFGIQLWGIVQDLSQLKRIYGESWQTFIGNSGVLQYFGSRDQMTAEYFSKLCGVTTINSLSESIATAVTSAAGGGSSSKTTTTSAAQSQRNLAYPDELMRLADDKQLLLVQNHNPISAIKVPWFEREETKNKGVDIRNLDATVPSQAPDPQSSNETVEEEPGWL